MCLNIYEYICCIFFLGSFYLILHVKWAFTLTWQIEGRIHCLQSFSFHCCVTALQHVSQAGQLDQEPAADIEKSWVDCQRCQRLNQASERDAEPSQLQGACGLFSDSEAERRGKTASSFVFSIQQNEQRYCTSLFHNDTWVFLLVGLLRYGDSLQWEKPDFYSDQPVCSWHWYHSNYTEMGSAAYGQISTNTRWGEIGCFNRVPPVFFLLYR